MSYKDSMNKQLVIGVGFLLLMMSLCGCSQPSDDKERFIGSWITEIKTNPMSGSNYTETRIFYANGSYSTTNRGIGNIPGSWRLAEGKLIIDTIYPGRYKYVFSENNTVLRLTSMSEGFTETLFKQS